MICDVEVEDHQSVSFVVERVAFITERLDMTSHFTL
jgi:hypothetical protein